MSVTTTSHITFEYSDGGRASSGYTGSADDCVIRAIAIAAGRDYQTVHDELAEEAELYAQHHNDAVARSIAKDGPSPMNGAHRAVYEPYLDSLGFVWTPTMSIGTGCRVHLRRDELPNDVQAVLRVSRHLCAYVDGVLYDNHDPSRDGTRCVYGYYWRR